MSGVASGMQKDIEDAVHNRPVRLPRVVIVGAGFGGLRSTGIGQRACAGNGDRSSESFHRLQPLLYWVATAGYRLQNLFSNSRYSAKAKKYRSIHGRGDRYRYAGTARFDG